MKSSKWVFSYGLSEKIDCEKDIPERKHVEFQTERDEKTGQKISGFSITVHGTSQKEAQTNSDTMARNLVNLLSASSRVFSDFYSNGYQEVGRGTRGAAIHSDTGENTTSCTPEISIPPSVRIRNIRSRAILSMSDEHFDAIVEGKHSGLNRILMHIKKASNARNAEDWETVITELSSAHNGKKQNLSVLRDVVSHSDLLQPNTVGKLKREFPTYEKGGCYFKLTDDKRFDLEDPMNKEWLRRQAEKFLQEAYAEIVSKLGNR